MGSNNKLPCQILGGKDLAYAVFCSLRNSTMSQREQISQLGTALLKAPCAQLFHSQVTLALSARGYASDHPIWVSYRLKSLECTGEILPEIQNHFIPSQSHSIGKSRTANTNYTPYKNSSGNKNLFSQVASTGFNFEKFLNVDKPLQ